MCRRPSSASRPYVELRIRKNCLNWFFGGYPIRKLSEVQRKPLGLMESFA